MNELEKKKQPRKKRQIPVRLNVLFFGVFILFSILILRLGFVQIVQGEEYLKELERTSNSTARIDAPRGIMYDSQNQIVVDNELVLSLTYTNPSQQTRAPEMIALAEKIEELIDIETDSVRDFTKREYLLARKTVEEVNALTEDEDEEDLKGLEPNQIFRLQIDLIPEEEIENLTEQELRVIAIYQEMASGYANTPQRIKKDITAEEAHIVSERLDDLPGIDILRDSERKYVYGDTLNTIFGRTGAIPREQIDSYLAKGYARSDLVGTSFLELQYEDALRGEKAVVENITTTSGNTTNRETNEKLGSRGNDLVLSIDMEYQQLLEESLEKHVNAGARSFIYDRGAYAIAMNPTTGEILGLAGYHNPVNEEAYFDYNGVINHSFEMGSTVKAASVLTGFQTGVMTEGTYVNDRPLTLPGATIQSVTRMGNVNYQTALERSSNIYMVEIALRLAKYNGSFNPDNYLPVFDTVRYYFNQFGLGVDTGVDLPSSAIGLNGGYALPGNLGYFMIGQFDTYTSLQMVQYISTIANGGYRMQPYFVSEIREPSTNKDELGAIIKKNEPTILNRVDMSDQMISNVQSALERVVHSSQGTASSRPNNPYRLETMVNHDFRHAAKTGTAQVKVTVGDGSTRDGNNQALVGYAPANNPEIAYAIVVPGVVTQGASQISQQIGADMINHYFDLKESRQGATPVENEDE
ncbi:penicillin-binding protein [Alkalihalobacillus trypoxylicola]|uniref:serine-type D-Ala-D-Ala carboxypeptidase n=1 Tax=Alkalihalobacillus trypoxylicola TaxID=519424 RepID=A0A162E925_9BACI|nr:penicillin-binding protein [Alkalihalobacillus trypoxylicola]